MARRGFSLVELLVVVSIIVVLAALIFPVLAQAKLSAKKTSALSAVRQIGYGLILYTVDHEDTYPRNDDCVRGSSLNPELNSPSYAPPGSVTAPGRNTDGCSGDVGPYPWRMNHYSWQKWVLPYVASRDLFVHPIRARIDQRPAPGHPRPWSDNGEIMGGYALNLGITGALNTWGKNLATGPSLANRNVIRNSIFGGRQTAIPNPSRAFILFEHGNSQVNFAPTLVRSGDNSIEQLNYPSAVRELWGRQFMRWEACTGLASYEAEVSRIPDERSTVQGGIVLGFVDGRAGFMKVQRFLALTPPASEYLSDGQIVTNACGPTNGIVRYSLTAKVNTRIEYPLWGLTAQ